MLHIDETPFSAAEMAARTEAAATRFAIASGTRYAVCFPDTIDWLAFCFAARSVGAGVMPLPPSTPRPAARRLAQEAGCAVLLFHDHPMEILPSPPAGLRGGQLIQLSSGTTGAPKVIARTWTEIAAEIESYTASFRTPIGMEPLIACPVTHSYGLICGLLVALHRGQAPHILNTGNPKYILKQVRALHRPLLYSSPVILHTLAQLTSAEAPFHAVMTSGTVLPDPWFAAIRGKATHFFQQYGCSEAGVIAVNPDLTASNDMGFVLPHHDLAAGQTADAAEEIVLRRPQGDIHTRDLGYRRDDGMLVFVARLDDTINVSGLNVYPQEVEDAVMGLPGVTDAVAFRKADPFAGERVALVFTARDPIALAQVRTWCRDRLAAHQQPADIRQVVSLPRKANGKISRREVAELIAQGDLPALEAVS